MRYYHMLEPKDWDAACSEGFYEAASLQSEKFIHFSHLNQVERVANLFYQHLEQMLLLEVDPSLCKAEWLEEDSEGTGELFPHLYGALEVSAVKRVHQLVKENHEWALPKVLKPNNVHYRQLILFDIDSTILVGSQTHKEAFQLSMQEHFEIEGSMRGIPVHGRTDPNIAREFLKVHGAQQTEIEAGLPEFLDGIVRHFLKLGPDPKSRLMPESRKCIEYLHQKGILLGLVTGNLELIGWQKLMQHQLDTYFTFGAFASDHSERPQMVKIALNHAQQQYKISPNNVLLVGDSIYDVEAALLNQIEVLAVCTGKHTSAELKSQGATNVEQNLSTEIFDALLTKIG